MQEDNDEERRNYLVQVKTYDYWKACEETTIFFTTYTRGLEILDELRNGSRPVEARLVKCEVLDI